MREAWIARCEDCGMFVVLYEQVEFVCGRCHGRIMPGAAIAEETTIPTVTLARLVDEVAAHRFMLSRPGPRVWLEISEEARELWRDMVRRERV